MDPAIQLIQLMLRVEREEEAQRRPYMAYRDDLADEKTDSNLKISAVGSAAWE